MCILLMCVISANDKYDIDHRSPVCWQRGIRCALCASLHSPHASIIFSLCSSLCGLRHFETHGCGVRVTQHGIGMPGGLALLARYTRRRPEPTCWVIRSFNPSEWYATVRHRVAWRHSTNRCIGRLGVASLTLRSRCTSPTHAFAPQSKSHPWNLHFPVDKTDYRCL